MTHDPARITALALAEHAAFLRALARGLLADDHLADDVVQSTWAAALERPGDAQNLAAWTAGVARNLALKLRRAAWRRERREQAIARPEAHEPEHAVVEREELLASLTAAVLALDEPYRSTVMQRYYEGLEPTEIARRAGIPVATVKSRLARALERLRERLDRTHESRSAWSVGLIGLAGLRDNTTVGAASTLVLGGILVSKLKFAGALALVLLVILLAWTGNGSTADSRAAAGTAPAFALASPESAQTRSTLAQDAGSGSASGSRTASEASTAPALGNIDVTARWKRDGSVAPGVCFRVIPSRGVEPNLDEVRVLTDASGFARVSGVAAGSVSIYGDRGTSTVVQLVAGATARAEILLGNGVDVEGRVVDEDGAPVAAADIWLSDVANGTQGMVVTQSGADGRFRLPSVPSNTVAARKPGYLPSAGISVYGSTNDTLEATLVLGRSGAALRVHVVDSAGAPVRGALVRCFEEAKLPVKSAQPRDRLAHWIPVSARTDAEGLADVEGLAPGPVRVVVMTAACAPFDRTVTLQAGEHAPIEARLQRGVTLRGTVRATDDEPVANAYVQIGDSHDPTKRSIRTDASGEYRIAGIAPGKLAVAASAPGAGRANTTLSGKDGAQLTWDATVDAGRVLRGRIVDARGEPLAGWQVNLKELRDTPGGWSGQGESGADGRFRILNCPDQELRLLALEKWFVSSVPELSVDGVRAGGDERTFTVPDEARFSARIAGRALGRDGGAVGAEIRLLSPKWEFGFTQWSNAATGSFEFSAVPPGTYNLEARGGERGYGLLRDVQIAAGQVLDVGNVTLGGTGRLEVRAMELVGLEPRNVQLAFGRADHGQGQHEIVTLEKWNESVGVELLPGTWTLYVGGSALPEEHVVEIRDGEVTTLTITPSRGAGLMMLLTAPRGGAFPIQAHATFRAGDLTIERELHVDALADDPRGLAWAMVPPGHAYELELRCKNGWTVTASLSPAQLDSPVPLELTLR